MAAGSEQANGADWFTAPEQVNHRRYEALRAFFVDGLTHAQAAEQFGYTRWTMVNLVREHRAGTLPEQPPPRQRPLGAAGHRVRQQRQRLFPLRSRRTAALTGPKTAVSLAVPSLVAGP